MNTSVENIVCVHSLLKITASRRPDSREVSVSECDVTWRRVEVERYCLPATTQRDISCDFSGFDFSIVSYMRLLFQLQGQ